MVVLPRRRIASGQVVRSNFWTCRVDLAPWYACSQMRATLLVVVVASAVAACGGDDARRDGGIRPPDARGEDAGGDSGVTACSCTVGSHNDLIYLMSDTGEVVDFAPIRVVGAASSPCVQTIPF